MKLAFFIDNMRDGGAQRVLSSVINHYANEGHCVNLYVAFTDPHVFKIDSRVNIIHLLNEKSPNDQSNKHRWKRFIGILATIRRKTLEFQPDIVISFIVMFNYKVILALCGTGIPVVVCEHSNVTREYKKINMILRRVTYPFSTAITVLTRRDYKLWKDKYRQVVYLPNPCDYSPFQSNDERENVILAAGDVTRWKIKGFDLLIQCWNKLCLEFPDWKLQIAGKYDSDSILYLKSLVSNFDDSRIVFLGFRDDISSLMRNSKIFCLSSRVEGLPMVLLEAMSQRCCCVAFDCQTGPSEIIRDNINGLLANDRDIDDMTQKLRKVMKDPCLRNHLASRSYESLQRYSSSRVFGRWDILFSKCVRCHARD